VYYIDKVWGLFGEMAFWVRPEKMFFEKVTRDGRTFNRFFGDGDIINRKL
jgi:hypothetical protein